MVITVTIPENWLRSLIPEFDALRKCEPEIKVAIKQLIIRGLNDAIPLAHPGSPSDGPCARVTISLPEPAAGQLRAIAASASLAVGPAAKRLIAGCLDAPPTLTPQIDERLPIVRLTRLLQASGANVQLRGEQVRMAGNLQDALANNKIGLVEASTGVGKARGIVCSAVEWVRQRKTSIVLAAPTIALLGQLAAECAAQAQVWDLPEVRVVFGKREYVSKVRLLSFLNSADGAQWNLPEVDAWVKAAGESPFCERGISISWLCSALERHCEGFPLDEVRLDELVEESDPGLISYKAQFQLAGDGGAIIICTHAMLAQHMRRRLIAANRDEDFKAINTEINGTFSDMRSRKDRGEAPDALDQIQLRMLFNQKEVVFAQTEELGLLPVFGALVVDEAHMLEEQFSNALTDYLSFQSVVRTANEYREAGGRVTVSTIQQIQSLVRSVGKVGDAIDRNVINLGAASSGTQTVKSLLAQLVGVLEAVPLPKKSDNPARMLCAIRLRRALALIRVASTSAQVRSYVRFSPVRSLPQLYIGRSTVETVLALLWSSVEAGAAVSATLYLGNETASAFYQKILLAIPADRAAEYPPIEAPWLTSAVRTVWIPGPKKAALLRPPSQSDRLSETDRVDAEANWLRNLASELIAIQKHSAGGVLVLMTALANIPIVHRAITHAAPSIVIIFADGNTPLAKQRNQFLKAAKAGQKPLWLAVGGAWTGLDVGGHGPWGEIFGTDLDAADDNVLTTLVIPRIPFGTNQTITHLWRKNHRPGVPWELFETAFRFKQGLGRLIRRPGLPENRDIYVLDGRLADKAFATTMPLFTKIMSRYKMRILQE